jgi:hypothetical protein
MHLTAHLDTAAQDFAVTRFGAHLQLSCQNQQLKQYSTTVKYSFGFTTSSQLSHSLGFSLRNTTLGHSPKHFWGDALLSSPHNYRAEIALISSQFLYMKKTTGNRFTDLRD